MPRTPERRLLWVVTAIALLYSAAHFARAGILQPLDHPNLGKFYEQVWPLRPHLETGAPVHTTNRAQYGPVFFFVMHPLLRANPDDQTLANWLYAMQLVLIVGSFLLTCAALKLSLPVPDNDWPLLVAWLAVLWLNFSPLYTILALKSVETWELQLISLGLYAHLRGWRWTAALAIASAALIKVLPAVFIYYWLIADRRTFACACVMLAALLLVSHLLYGPEMGLWYLPRVVAGAAGDSYGLNWHENISLKAALAKLFGYLPAPTRDGALTSGYFLVLTGWRKTAATVIGDTLVLAAVAGLTWTWLRRGARRTREITLWEWSVLTVAVLIVSPNTIFEYVTIALGAVSYAFVRIALSDHRVTARWVALAASLLLVGGLVPRQWLNRLTMVDLMNQWTGHTHLTGSEAYQYYGFPLAGLLLLVSTTWRLEPATGVLIAVNMTSTRRASIPALVWTLWIQLVPSTALARQTGVQPPVPDSPPPSPVEQALIEYRCRVARKEMSEECLTAQLLALRTDFGSDLSRLSAAERRTADSVCNKILAARGREAYVQCLSDQLVALRERRIRANPPPPPPPEATPALPSVTDPSAGAQQPPPAPQPSRSYGLWIGAALAVLGIAAGGAFLAMRTRRTPRKCRVCGASVSDSGDLCQPCRHDAAEALRRAATERAEQQRAQEEARRRQSEQAEEDGLQKARQEEAARLRVQEQARQAEEARRAEELRQREDEARQRSQVAGSAQGEFDPYATLGVAPDATREAIETAYQAAKVKYDPENAAFLPSELQELFKAKGLAAERAYKMLTE